MSIGTGRKFECVTKEEIARLTGYKPYCLDDSAEVATQYVCAIDSFAEHYGYEFFGFTAQHVILRKIN